jgi:predicted RNA polymerase sigma factor
MRPELCDEATRLGRVVAGLMPDEPEVHGLAALMDIQASRAKARTDATGEPIRLLDQDRSRWNQLLIRRGLASLAHAEQVAGSDRGPYLLQAAIAACHARARTAAETDWMRIVVHYRELIEIDGSPIVELNRAVAVGMAFGPAAGLELVDTLVDDPQLTRAAAMTRNDRERALLEARAANPTA